MNFLPEGVAVVNANADIVYTNKSLHRILKSNRKNIGKTLMDLKNSLNNDDHN